MSKFRDAVAEETVAAQPLPEGKEPEATPPLDPETDEPIALYKELQGKPYSSVYFEMDGIWKEIGGSLKEDLETIDQAYQKRVSNGSYQDGEKTFKEMIKEAEKLTDTKNAGNNLKIAKVAEYLRFIERLGEIDKQAERWL